MNQILKGLLAFTSLTALILAPILLVAAALNLDAWLFWVLMSAASLVTWRVTGALLMAILAQERQAQVRAAAEKMLRGKS